MLQHTQWLHGAFLRLVANDRYGVSDDWLKQTVGWLKLKALFGAQIVLSDAQLNDSAVIMHLFSQPTFRAFLAERPGFLHLQVHKQRIKEDSQFGRATTSLNASLRSEWMSSTFRTPHIQQEFAKIILDRGYVDNEKDLHPKSRFNKLRSTLNERDQERLVGLLYAIEYFSSVPNVIVADSTNPFDDMYSVLIRTLDRLRNMEPTTQRNQDLLNLNMTLKFIDQLPLEKRAFQSDVWTAAEKLLGRKHPNYRAIKHTTHHAWNTSIQNSLGVESGSLANTEETNAVQVGKYAGFTTDTFVPANVYAGRFQPTKLKHRLIPYLPMEFDPMKLSWRVIGGVSQSTQSRALRFQESLRPSVNRNHEINEALNDLCSELRICLGPKFIRARLVPWQVWMLSETIAFAIPKAISAPSEVNEYIHMALPFIPEVVETAFLNGQYAGLTNILKSTGKQMIPNQQDTN